MSSNRVKLVCKNTKCLNKAPVWRVFDSLGEYSCKACHQPLVAYRPPRDIKHNIAAKQDLREVGN